jgi:hypothetical protein
MILPVRGPFTYKSFIESTYRMKRTMCCMQICPTRHVDIPIESVLYSSVIQIGLPQSVRGIVNRKFIEYDLFSSFSR